MLVSTLQLESCLVDLDRRVVERDGKRTRLTSREVEIITYLLDHAGRTVPREELERQVFEIAPGVATEACAVAMRRLRSKLEDDPKRPAHLHTVRGVGWSLVVPDAPTEDEARHNLPAPWDAFVGRSAERTQLEQALDAPERLVCVHGPPGVGKSRLALEVLGDRADRGETWWLSLHEDAVRTDLPSALAGLMGLTGSAALDTALAARSTVRVVLDDAEEATAEHATIVGRWLRARGVRVLALSRVRLGWPGERDLPLRGLEGADAATLLRRRIEAVRPDFEADDATLLSLAEGLDGLPLAIELGAQRARMMDAEGLREHLRARPLGGALDEALRWSWERSSDAEREALSRLAVFQGGFTRDAALAVLDGLEPSPWEVFEALVDRSLVTMKREDLGLRFALLTVVRQFVDREAPPSDDARERHRRWFVGWAREQLEGLYVDGGIQRLRALGREEGNLSAGRNGADPRDDAKLGLALVRAAFHRGQSARRVELAKTLPVDALTGGLRDACLAARASALASLAHTDEAMGLLAEPLEGSGDAWGLARRTLGVCHLYRGELEEMVRCGRETLAAADLHPKLRAMVLLDTAVALGSLRRSPEAIALAREALAISEEQGDALGLGPALGTLGDLLRSSGDSVDEARSLLLRGIEVAQAADALGVASSVRMVLGRLEGDVGSPACEEHMRAASRLHRARGNFRNAAQALDDLAEFLVDQGQLDRAEDAGVRARLLRRVSGGRDGVASAGNEGVRAWAGGDRERAERLLREAVHGAREVELLRPLRLFAASLAAVLAEQARGDDAREVLSWATDSHDTGDQAIIELSRAHVALVLDGDRQEAEAALAAERLHTNGRPVRERRADLRIVERMLRRALDRPRED